MQKTEKNIQYNCENACLRSRGGQANPQIFMIYPQIANPQISTKYCTTLSQNSHKSRLCKRFLCKNLN